MYICEKKSSEINKKKKKCDFKKQCMLQQPRAILPPQFK